MPQIKTVLIATAGAALGGLVVFLLAPHSGSATRQKLKSMALRYLDTLLEKAEQKLEDAYERSVAQEYAYEENPSERTIF